MTSESPQSTYFPHSKSVLWNRCPVRTPRFLKAVDIIPSLFLSSSDISAILTKLESASEDYIYPTINFSVVVNTLGDCKDEEVSVFKTTTEYGGPKYAFTVVKDAVASAPENKSLALPVALDSMSFNDKDRLSFDPHSTK